MHTQLYCMYVYASMKGHGMIDTEVHRPVSLLLFTLAAGAGLLAIFEFPLYQKQGDMK